jgi:hypothetical protein
MAADLSDSPRSGLDFQLCGDEQLPNIGRSPCLIDGWYFGVDDLDEALPGPFEYSSANGDQVTIMRALVKLTLEHTLAATLADDIAATLLRAATDATADGSVRWRT